MVLFLLVLNFLLAIIVEAYMKVREAIENLNTEVLPILLRLQLDMHM
jgi:hypothetical protein